MSNKILVTDNLFIFDEHVKKLEAAGFEVERLDKPEAIEAELIEAVKGKLGYILGGIEQVTEKVIDAADELKAIAFTGIDQAAYIPAWKYALKKGISISNVPDGPTDAVAEWAMGAALLMNRGYLQLGDGFGDKTTLITHGLLNQVVGIIGLGRIGTRITEMLQPFKPAKVIYTSLHQHEDKEQSLGVKFEPNLQKLLAQCDVVFLAVPSTSGPGFFAKPQFDAMKKDALLVSFVHTGVIDSDSLFDAVSSGKVRAISDLPVDERFSKLAHDKWFSFKLSNAYLTAPSLAYTSNVATQSMINMLTKGDDEYIVEED